MSPLEQRVKELKQLTQRIMQVKAERNEIAKALAAEGVPLGDLAEAMGLPVHELKALGIRV